MPGKTQPNGISIYTTSERDALSGVPSDDYLIFNKTDEVFQNRVSSVWEDVGGVGNFYTESFDATTSWGAPSGGLYTITITAGTHGKGTSVSNVIVYETVGGDSEKVMANEVFVDNTTGDVSFNVTESPDGRFAGKVIIQGANQGDVFGYSTVQEEGSPLTQRSVLNFIGSDVTATDNSGNGTTDITISSSAVAYESSFDATTSWGAASGGLYTIAITAATHGKGTNVSNITLYETVGGDSVNVLPNTAFFDSSTGDVSFTVSESPDGRFAGKVVILGKDVGSGTGYRTVQEDGAAVNQRANLNFGNGLTASDNAGSSRTDVVLDPNFTLTTRPTFHAQLSAAEQDVTGDGTAHTIGSTSGFTEIYDQGGDFNTNGTFTAPVTGRYLFTAILNYAHISTRVVLTLVTSNRNYAIYDIDPTSLSTGTAFNLNGSTFADMDASDTATLVVTGSGATKLDDVGGNTFFSGSLIC